MRTKFKPWTVNYLSEHSSSLITNEEIKDISSNYFLEIGSGKGNFLLNMAVKFQAIFFIGIEKNTTCAGITLKKLVDNKIGNAKLYYGDAINYLKEVPNESVDGIFLNFSDPWPKVRHHKRRLTSNNFLEEYYRALKSRAKIYFKTDNIDLFNESLKYFENSKFEIISVTNDYQKLDDFDCMTEYEESFRNQNIPINRAIFIKK